MNQHFKHPGRAAYELPYLLKGLGDVDGGAPLTDDQLEKAHAIENHADDAINSIASGLEAIGAVMSLVGHSDDVLCGRQMAGLGDLIKHLAVEIEYLHEVEGEMYALKRRSIAVPQESPAPRQRAAART